MAANKVQYVLGISADTSQAKKSIQELQNALNAITTANNKKLGLDIDLNNAAKAAQQLQASLNSAINVDTGRLNFTAFNKSLMQSNTNLSQLITQLRSTGGLGNQAVSQLARSLSTAEIPVKRMTGLLGNFATTLSNSFKWQISSNIIHGLESSMNAAVGYAKDLNETLNNIRIVTGQSVDDMAKFAVNANKAAKELSTTTKEYANASLIYYQQGDSAEMVAKKAATTIKAANVAFTASAKEMSEMLTAVWNSYQVGADQLESVVDVMAKLGATTASSMEEMATAMQKVASTANTVGVSMQQMSAIVATSASVTRQAPETVGTAWNTILSRIGGLKLGETLEDGVDLNKYSKALQVAGVSILDATGEMRDMGNVIDELGVKWQTLSRGQKAALAQTIGGARQYTQIMAFFDNFDKYQKNLLTASNARGALQEQQEIYAQGWEAASARSRAALEELWSALIDDEAMIAFTNGMTKMTEGVTGLVKAFGGLPGILATVSSLMARTFSNQIVTSVSKAAASVVGFGQAFTKQGNGQPMSGGYTIRQLLMGKMPNAEERAQISNLAVTRDILLQTARTGVGLDQENPFYNQLRQSNGLQAGAYTAQIQAMRQGGNLTPVQMLNLANLQQRAQHTQNAYDILDAFHEDTSAVSSNLIHTNQGASNIFAGLSKAMYREELMKIQERATGAAGEELEAYKSQFADIAKKAGINDAVFGSYKPAANTTSSDTLARKFGSLEFKGLTEAERRQVIADTRQATAQSIQATRSQFNPNRQIDPASQFKAIGEAARTAVTGITSGVAAFNQLNGAMAAFNSGNVVQGLTNVATTATSVAQAFIVGGPVAGAIASAGAVLGLVVGQYTADMEKAANKAKETTEKITNSTQELETKVSNIATQSNGYDALVEQLSKGAITQDEFNNSLLTVANSLGVQGANVLALSGNYKELEAQVKQTIAAQLQQTEISGKTLVGQAENSTASTLYTAFKTYGLKTSVFSRPGDDTYTLTGMFNPGLLANIGAYSNKAVGPGETNYAWLNRQLGFQNVKYDGFTHSQLTLGSDFDSLVKFLNGVKELEQEAEANFGTKYGSAIYDLLNDSSFKKLRSAAETAVAPVSAGLRSQYSAAGQQFVAGLNASVLSGYNMQARQSLIDQFLGQQNLSEEKNPEAYQIGKEIISSLVDSTIAGMGAEGAKLSSKASTAANKKEDWTKRLKAMGLNPDTIIGRLSDEQLNSSLGLGYWMSGGRSNIDTTARDAWAISQSALEAYNNRGSNFNVGSFADQYIYSNSALSGYAGVTQEEFKKLSTDAQRHILVNWIENIKNASDELSVAADNSDFANVLKNTWDNLVEEWNKDIGGALLDESQSRSILNYSKEAFTEDSQKAENEQSEVYKLIQDRFNGNYQVAQRWAQELIDTNPALNQKASAAQDTPLGQLISQAQTLANMDINDITKWKEDIAQSLAHHDISIDKWLNMSELEKRQVQLAMLQEKIQEIRANMAKEGTGETDELVELEYEAKQLQSTFNELTLKSLQEQINAVNQEWEDMQGHAEKVMDLISSHQGKGFQSFSDIEALRQSLLGAGIEGERVASIIKEIQDLGNDGKTDDKDAWAGVGAATAAALVSVSADQQKNKGYEGLVDTATVKQLDLSGATFVPEKVDIPAQAPTVDTTNTQQTGTEPQVKTTAEEVKTSSETPVNGTKPSIDSIVANAIEANVSQDKISHSNISVIKADSINAEVEQGKISYNDIEKLEVQTVDATGENTKYELSESEKLKVALLYTGEGVEVEGLENKTFSLDTVLSILPETTEDGKSTDFIKEWLKENYPDGVQFDAKGNITGFDTNSEEATAAAAAANEALKGKLTASIKTKYDTPSNPEFLDTLKDINGTIALIYDSIQDTKGVLSEALAPGVKPVEIKYTIGPNAYAAWADNQMAKANGTTQSIETTFDQFANKSFNKNNIAYAFAGMFGELTNLDANSFNGDNLAANMIAEITARALASENGDIRYFGQMLMAGLATSLGDAVKTVNWEGILSGLGPEIYNAFATELETHSPSRLTWVFGQFLVSGVQGGLSEAIQNYQPNVSGLGAKIFAAFQNELKDGSIEASINQQAEAYANKMVSSESSDWLRIYKEKQQELWSDKSKYFERDYLAGNYLSDSNLSKEERVALGAAIDTALTKAGKKSLDEVDDKLFDSIQQEINKLYTNNVNAINSTVAEMKDIWKGALDQVYENEQETAQNTYDIWEKTFQSIAKAREALLNGQSITDAMGTNASDMTNMYRLLMEEHGMTYEQATSFMDNPNASLSTLDYMNSYNGKTASAYWSSDGREYFTSRTKLPTWEEYSANRLRQTHDDLNSDTGINQFIEMLDNLISISNNKNASSEEQSAALSQLTNLSAMSGGLLNLGNVNGSNTYSLGSHNISSNDAAKILLNNLLGDEETLSMLASTRGYQTEEAMKNGFYEGLGQDRANQNLVNNQMWEEEASAIGKSSDAVKEHAKALLELQGDYRNLNELSKAEREQMAKVAAENLRATDGWKELGSMQKSTFKILNSGKTSNTEYIASTQKVQSALKKIFGDSKAITADFVKNHLKEIQRMAKGDKKAGEELEEAILRGQAAMDEWDYDKQIDIDINKDGVVNQLDTVGELFNNFGDQYADKLAGFKIDIDDSQALSTLDALLSSGQMTVDQMNAAFATIGWIPEIEYTDVTVGEAQAMGINGQITATLPDGQQFVGTIDGNEDALADAVIHIPHIKSAKKTGGGASGSKPPKSGGGGGGKKNDKKPLEKKRVKDEGERYHEIRDKLEQQEHILDRIDKIKDRAYGGRHLKALEDEIAAIEKENKLQEEYYAEAAAYLASDRAELTSYGATFNEDGTVNYDEYIRTQVDWWNSHNGKYTDEEKKELEQQYEDRMKALENYEEALDLVDTIQNDMLENQNKISELLLEAVQYKLEITVELNDRDIEKLDYYINKWSDILNRQDESMEVSMMKMQDYESSLAAIGEAYQKLQEGHAAHQLNDTDYAEGLADLQDKTLEYLNAINDLNKEIADYYENTLSLAEEKEQKYADKIEHTRNMMQSYIEMQQLMGRGQNFAELNSMYETSYQSSLLTAQAARNYLDTLYASRAAIIRQIEESGWTDVLKEQYDSVEQHIINAEDDLAEKTQQTLEDAKSKFQNTIDAILKATDLAFKALVDANGNLILSFDEVAKDFNYWNEQQGWYVSTAKELYEVSKINRQIDDSIADSTTATSKERLKALRDEINAYAEKNRLTEYDIEMNELQYKMALAMQNLEDNQNAKSTVRLTRDENGNYGYQYTANEDDVSAARQNFEDVLQQINELSYEHQNDLVQQMIESKQNYQSELKEILEDDTLSLEERNRQAEVLTDQHLKQMEYIQEQGMRAQEQLLENQGYIQEYYGQTIIENTGLVQDQIHSMMQQLMQESDGYTEYVKTTLKKQLNEAVGIYGEDINEVSDETGLSWNNMENSVAIYNKTNEKAASDIKTLDQILGDSLANISSATAAWTAHNQQLQTTISLYENLFNKMQNIQTALADINIQDRYYNNGAIVRPNEAAASDGIIALYTDKNKTNFTENKFEGSPAALSTLHNTTMSEYDISSTDLWKLIDNTAVSNLLGLVARGMNNTISGNTNGDALAQTVNINANFDNIQSAQDIIDAFNQLVNLASQYAYNNESGS